MKIIACIALVLAFGCGSSPSPMGDDDVPLGCGDGVVEGAEQCDDGNDDRFDGCRPDCTSVELLEPTPMTWQYFEIPDTTCIDGTPAGFSVNYNPASPNLVVYLEGGGACFNQFCDSLFSRSGMQPSDGGIFDRANAANPVADWTWVYVPYCTGDVYGGQAETMLAGELRSFTGYSNHTAFLERWVPSFPSETVVLTGSSAGGFGAAVNFAQTQRAFSDTPVVLVDDSGPPMSADVFPPCLQSQWRTTWGFDDTVLAECGGNCPDPDNFIEDLFAHVRTTFPDMRGGLFSSVGDQTIRVFAGYGWGGGYNVCQDIPTAVTAPVFEAGLDEVRATAMTAGPGFGTFYIPGNSHTILRSGSFYSATAGGTTVAEWMGDVIEGTAAHLGP